MYIRRWLRCMLVREFNITQALNIWDSIFAYQFLDDPKSKKFKMLDYLCVTMMISLADESKNSLFIYEYKL